MNHAADLRRTAWLAPVLVALTVAAGCSSGGSGSGSGSAGSSPTPEASTSPSASPSPPPVAGQCHRLTFAGAAQPEDSSQPVPCGGPHTAQTLKVGSISTLTGGAGSVDSGQVRDAVAKACPQRLLRRLGGDETTRRLSRFEVVWFTPTKEASDAGASWFRCDVVGLAAANSLIRLPRTVIGVLDASDALDTFGTCGTTAPGKPGFSRVICRRKHAWRAVGTVDLSPSARYLGKAAAAQGDSACKDIAAARANGALKYTWSFEWPTRDVWNSGQRYGYCWVPAT